MSILTREQWLEKRKSHVTATDIGAIVGLNPWKSKLSVWLEKTGRSEPVVETLPMRLGKMLQPVVLDLYDSETGLVTRRCGDTELIVCEDFPLAAATPDAEVVGERVVEAKTASGRGVSRWGEPGTVDAVPDYYALQVYWQAMVMKSDVADLAALLSGNEFRIYEMVRGRNLDLEAQLREAALQFWTDYVLTDTMPPIDASSEAAAFLARQFPKENKGVMLPASAEAEQIRAELRRANEMLDVSEVQVELAKNQLKEIIGEAEGLEFSDGKRARWAKTKDGTKTDWEKVARHAARPLPKDQFESLVKHYSVDVPGIRKFYKPKEEK